jgi:microcystin-dependent protein
LAAKTGCKISKGIPLPTADKAPEAVAGGSQPISIQQPFLGMNYIICLYGIFPSRS